MHQITITIQGAENATLAQTIAAIDLAKGRLAAGMSNGVARDGNVGFEFEAREVDAEHAVQRLLPASGAAHRNLP